MGFDKDYVGTKLAFQDVKATAAAELAANEAARAGKRDYHTRRAAEFSDGRAARTSELEAEGNTHVAPDSNAAYGEAHDAAIAAAELTIDAEIARDYPLASASARRKLRANHLEAIGDQAGREAEAARQAYVDSRGGVKILPKIRQEEADARDAAAAA